MRTVRVLQIYSNCSCVNSPRQTAEPGYCDISCFYVLVPYTIGLIFFSITANIYQVSSTNVILKCVGDEDKLLALSVQIIMICIAVFPYSLIFGQMIDWICILWKTSSCGDEVGSCLAYDHSKFALVMHAAMHDQEKHKKKS
ncbi:hypothetical protein HELRODRAFT_161323 [Helobdella robusta]|uniref:Uncharacterized protein n=1 Tax=Helobdella robusta TaxID=6412 RepID=T1ERC2_HELRO|nr:hypothetical protein HELRODRAFT_161323 [Helobdella robusta]ESO02092.1 hypothetical protein HELRODRAFT_161323 [Helobdella robusta]